MDEARKALEKGPPQSGADELMNGCPLPRGSCLSWFAHGIDFSQGRLCTFKNRPPSFIDWVVPFAIDHRDHLLYVLLFNIPRNRHKSNTSIGEIT